MTEFTEPLRWFTLFGPAPFTLEDCQKLRLQPENSRIGDTRDYRNAQGALIWGLILFGVFVLVHSGILFRFKVWQKGFTLPHHIRFGGWETRVLHALIFPVSTAAAYCLTVSRDALLNTCVQRRQDIKMEKISVDITVGLSVGQLS